MKAVSIYNLDNPKYHKNKARVINENLPKHPFRGVFVGASNSGKTNVLVNLLLKHLAFDKCYLFCPSATCQPKYLMLKDEFEKLDKKIESDIRRKIAEFNRTHRDKKIDSRNLEIDPITEFEEDIPTDLLDMLDPEKQNLICFDDMILHDKKKQDIINSLYVRGRHKNASVLNLVQSYYRCQRLQRLQCNFFLLFHPLGAREIGMIHSDVGCNVPKKVFIERILDETKSPYSFVVIDLDSKCPYRKSDFKTPLFGEWHPAQ